MAKFAVHRTKKASGVSFMKNIRLDPLGHNPNSNSNGSSTPQLEVSAGAEMLSSLNTSEVENKTVSPNKKQATHRWKSLLTKVLESLTYEGRWFYFLLWKISLKRGIRLICSIRKRRIDASLVISKTWRMAKARRISENFKHQLSFISTKYRQFYAKTHVFGMKKAGRALCMWAKKIFAERSKAALVCQRIFRGFKERKVYRPLVLKAVKARNHQKMLKRQAEAVQERKRKTAAVKTIEKAYQQYQYKLKLKEYRKYLWTLPYECRILYLKFKQVKRDADSLKADVETMIAKKEEERLKENS